MRKLSAILAALFAGIASVVAAAAAGDPPVPPGRDPGGVAVAIIGTGVDYLRPNIAQRLARDGEGEIIGYDFLEDDRRPFASDGPNAAAELLLAEGQAATLVPVRAALAPTKSTGAALSFAAAAPGRIVWFSDHVSLQATGELIRTAAERFPDKLFIAATSDPAVAATITGRAANLILVDAHRPAVRGELPPQPEPSGGISGQADVAAPLETDGGQNTIEASAAAVLASARVAALAARLTAVDPEVAAAQLKARILSLGERLGDAGKGRLFIADPRRHFWLE